MLAGAAGGTALDIVSYTKQPMGLGAMAIGDGVVTALALDRMADPTE